MYARIKCGLVSLCALWCRSVLMEWQKAHDEFSPAHWTSCSETFRIFYPPFKKAHPPHVKGLGSGSIRPVKKGFSTDSLVNSHIQKFRSEKKSFKFDDRFDVCCAWIWACFFFVSSLLWFQMRNVPAPGNMKLPNWLVGRWELPLNRLPTLPKAPPTKPTIPWEEKTQISPKCFIAMKRHANRTEQQLANSNRRIVVIVRTIIIVNSNKIKNNLTMQTWQ